MCRIMECVFNEMVTSVSIKDLPYTRFTSGNVICGNHIQAFELTNLFLNTLRTGDADLRLYITTVQYG